MSSVKRNRKYLERLIAPMLTVPAEVAAEISVRIFSGAVGLTAFDSGQASLNWHLETYSGTVSFAAQQMFWGYVGVAPVAPAGYKWSGGGNEMKVKSDLVMQQMQMLSELRHMKFDAISVYNPIQPGFSGFAPGNDEKYFEYALGEVEAKFGEIISSAVTEGIEAVVSRHSFLRTA